MSKNESRVKREGFTLRNLVSSVWFFPLLLTILLVIFTGLKISGSSLSAYSWTFGEQQGSNLIANKPQNVRSDEWLVNTQMMIAQKNNGFARINPNIGGGEDLSFLVDVPYKEWSAVFKPQNLAFFVLPFDQAFAFKWWVVAYLFMLSCYFFTLTLLPGRKLLASLLAVGFFFSPFIQWWYLYGTLGTIYYSLFGATIFIKILNQKKLSKNLAWAALLAYIMTCFALMLYLPFQIPCVLAASAFALGYGLQKLRNAPRKVVLQKVGIILGAAIIAGVISLTFILTRSSVVNTINNTVYPGRRVITGGGYDFPKLFSGHLQTQLQFPEKAVKLRYNQSENSNFILLAPFLILPSAVLLVRQYRQKKALDWPLLTVNVLLVVVWIHFFTPALDLLLKPLFLSKVPLNRLVIGMGLLNFLQLVLFIRHIKDLDIRKHRSLIKFYMVPVFLAEAGIALWMSHRFPGYIGAPKAIVLSALVTLIVYLIMTKRFIVGAAVLAALSFYSTYQVNPLYRGTAPLTETPLSKTIKEISRTSNGTWITESIQFENFPQMNGAKSLSGTYTYPQLNIWKDVSPKNQTIYNRYAHVIFVINHENNDGFKTHLAKLQNDVFLVFTEPCSNFLRDKGVRYILAQAPIADTCLTLKTTVPYPAQTFFIYEIKP